METIVTVQPTVYAPSLVLAAAVALSVAAFGWRFRSDPGDRWFVLAKSPAYALELSMEGILPTPFWTRIGWIPYELLLVGLLLLSLELAGHGEWITRRTLPLFLVWPAVTFLLVFTSGSHSLLCGRVELASHGGLLEHSARGFWYWAETAYGFTVALVSFGLFVRRAATETGLYRKQALVMGAGVGVPIVAAAVDVVHPLAPVRLTPILFLPTGVLFWWGLTRYRVLELVLLARDLAIEHMSDPVVVLDTDDCLVDYNPAAAALFGLSDGDFGSSAEAVVDPETDSGTLADGEEVVVDAGGRPATSRSTASPSPTAAATPEAASTCSTT